MDLSDVTASAIAVTGLLGAASAYVLGKRGQKNDEKQQEAATKLQKRITAFDELESLNDRLSTENARLRDLYSEAETRGDARMAVQAKRCREQLQKSMDAMSTLQSVVLSEIAKASAEDAIERGRQHILEDHAEYDEPDL
jgi:hypothetical protein